MKETFITELRAALQSKADPETKESAGRFFKDGEKPLVYGVKSAGVRQIAKGFLKRAKGFMKSELYAVCEELWRSQYLEEAVIACVFSESLKKQYEPSDFKVFERWVTTYVNNWADCDTLCNHTVGEFMMKYPEYVEALKGWATSPHCWTKRAAAVSLIIPTRKGLFLQDIFEIADILLHDKDDLVQKGYGWMLKAASESHPTEVYEYVLSKRATMPRTALRYAIEKLPPELKAEAMKR